MAVNLENINGLRIVRWPDPVLTQNCRKIRFSNDGLRPDDLPRLASKMLELMRGIGVGIAAPQVGLPLRMFVWSVEGDEGAVVNPILSDPTGEDTLVEGCLSLPGVRIDVRRPISILMSGEDLNGAPLSPPARRRPSRQGMAA